MKKILVFISLIICLVGLSACGTEDKTERPDSNTPTDDDGNGTEGDDGKTDVSKLKPLSKCVTGDTMICDCTLYGESETHRIKKQISDAETTKTTVIKVTATQDLLKEQCKSMGEAKNASAYFSDTTCSCQDTI